MTKPTLHVGTSGYSYKEWKGSFYPEDLPAKQMLSYYGERFSAVEINASFYKLPAPATLESWAAEVPSGFHFTMKAPQRITHFQRLKGADQTLAEFVEVARTFKKRLGPLLFGLPPNFKKDVPRLADFLAAAHGSIRMAFEFRHQSWFDDETFTLLAKHKVALCVAEADDDLDVPFEPTAPWGYLRLRKADYTDAALKNWVKRVNGSKSKETYIFFKHEETGTGPRFARRFLDLAGKE